MHAKSLTGLIFPELFTITLLKITNYKYSPYGNLSSSFYFPVSKHNPQAT